MSEGDFPHLLVFGPNGAGELFFISELEIKNLVKKGKKTRVNCILRELYGSGIEKLKMDRHEVSFVHCVGITSRYMFFQQHYN